MKAQGPSNGWELETRRILESQLPEYDVDPHMRLANVVKGRTQFVKAMSQYEVDFTVRDKQTGHVFCAIELDGPTHDTEDGQRRDTNKSKWLEEAGIKLIRIRKPEDAYAIRNRMGLANNFDFYHEGRPTFMTPKRARPITRYVASLIAVVAIAGLLMWSLNKVAANMLNQIGKNTLRQQPNTSSIQRNQTEMQRKQMEENIRKQNEWEQAEARRRVEAKQPRYERVLVKGKSARECANGNVITNETILCTKDHYEMVLVNDPQ